MRENSTVLHRLQLWAIDRPEQAALHCQDESHHWKAISTKAYWLQVVRLAQALMDSGIRPGDRVMLYAFNSPEWIEWELAVWLAKGISVGVHPSTHGMDLSAMISEATPSLILVESEVFREKIKNESQTETKILTFEESIGELLKTESDLEASLLSLGQKLLDQVNPESPQMIIFTSGTTGKPKGVVLGLRQLTFVSDSLAQTWNLPFMDGELFSFLPLAHIAEKIQSIGVAISQRYGVWFNSRYDRFLPELKEVRPTLLLAVPRIWERFKEQIENQKPKILQRILEIDRLGAFAEKIYLSKAREALGLDRLKLAVSGAAKLAPSVAKWFNGLGIEIQEIYGMSESCGLISMTQAKREDFTLVGSAPVGVEIKITQEGEIWVRGPNVFQGYWNDETATKEVLLEDGWLKTGDLGEWKRELHILGRNREIIKLSNGRMIAPISIENALKEIPEISNVCVMGEGRAYPLAIVTLTEKALMEFKFVPGAIEGLVVEDESLKSKIRQQIEDLLKEKKLSERVSHFIILSRDFSIEQKELTATHKLSRNQIQKNFKYFIDLSYES